MIITRIIGGLGNQMFQYAIARAMAERNQDNFKLDISFYPKQTLRKYELNLFNIQEDIATKEECIAFRGKEDFLFKVKQRLKLPLNRPKTYVKEIKNPIFDEKIYSIKSDVFLDGFWQNEQYFKEIREILIKEFTPKNSISQEAIKYLKNIENTNSISLHVRRGDYINDKHTNSVHGVCGIDYYKRAIAYMNRYIDKPVFYIFSDDIDWCKENFDFIENKIFIDNTKSAFDDLELMKNCKHNIIANSTFSWWGAWLNQNYKKIVVVPTIWWSLKPKLHIATDQWVKL